jgi:Flp pilus assembly pilin Flp
MVSPPRSVVRSDHYPKEATTMLTLWIAAQNRWAALEDDRGASMVEYALLVVLIALVVFLAVKFAGRQVSKAFDTVGKSIANG